MSFLDNLENHLETLESRETSDPAGLAREAAARAAEAAEAARIAPIADELRNGPFTARLLVACRMIGHQMRISVRLVWIGSTLRLEARDRKLELRPITHGVEAVLIEGAREESAGIVNLKGDAEALIRRWLAGSRE
jgi:hypothetical protein